MTVEAPTKPPLRRQPAEIGRSYACAGCDVFGRVAPGGLICCWQCGRDDRLRHR